MQWFATDRHVVPRCRILVRALFLSLLATSCVRTTTRTAALSKSIHSPELTTVPRDGVYKVKWSRNEGPDWISDWNGIDWTSRNLHSGDLVGFVHDERGDLIAIAGDERLFVPEVPSDAKYCAWFHKTHHETQFGHNVEQLGRSAAMAAAVVGLTALGASVIAADIWANSLEIPDAETQKKHLSKRDREHLSGEYPAGTHHVFPP
jgi:hypothetical protein